MLELKEQSGGTTGFGGLTRRISKAIGRKRADDGAMLVVASRHRLWQRYGPDGLTAIERATGDLFGAMGERGLDAAMVYADDSPLLGQFGVLPAEVGQPESVARTVRDLAARMEWTGAKIRYVLILGDDGVIPFHRPENPSPEDGDELVSDHPYGVEPDDPLRPVRAVGRLPDPDLETLLATLRHAAAAHRRLAAGEAPLLEPQGFGYSASVWKRAARGVFETLSEPTGLRLSPPLSHREIPEPGSRGPRYRYFNLHGLKDSPHWFGQRDPSFAADYPMFPVALRPVDLDPAPGSVVFSEACFGAHIEGRSVRDSVALTYMAGGTLAFAGATGVAYGGLDGPLVAADLLAQRYWQALLAGAPAGQAMAFAKRRLIEETLSRQGYLDSEDEKAVLNFVLYGDPSLTHASPTVWDPEIALDSAESGPTERVGSADRVGTLPIRPHAKSGTSPGDPESELAELAHSEVPGDVPDELIDDVRQVISKRLPEFASPDVTVSTSLAPRRALPKAMGPALGPGSAPVVVTLQKSAKTCCGTPCSETVRVTVDRQGRVRKVVIAR